MSLKVLQNVAEMCGLIVVRTAELGFSKLFSKKWVKILNLRTRKACVSMLVRTYL